ncbi:allantoate amidohydrolase [Glycomyces buryatensis]|uniref:Allantoate amidohydrolase n=1 Tax=Glycomyces buryatensis TaxID=2570927 RepID=A0A4S8QEV7_9ACTN|nr:allantoate amidohydrolase [Glycomyces buryatensis]THV39779.1 allantoate amidohydrolase [Glycomyces buryatensis]
MDASTFRRMWDELLPVGRTENGYVRHSWTDADQSCRNWFRGQAEARDMAVETDRNGNLYAWWGPRRSRGAILTGSHFDSVPHGGAYDGPLGIVSAFLAVDALRERDATLQRPIGIAAFTEEEGGRFGVPCLGTRLMTGALDPDRARKLTDASGITLAEAMEAAGVDPGGLGPDPERLERLGAFVELHIEQGRALEADGDAVGVASAIWPHGRWRLTFTGEGNHAGTTLFADRRDPMLTFAFAVLAARKEARLAGGLATVGRVEVDPGATNAIAKRVDAWLDARAPDEATLNEIVSGLESKVGERAARDGTGFTSRAGSESPLVGFDEDLRDRVAALLGGAPVLPTGAGHDAGVLAAHVPTAMLFVRNETGVSHAPAETADDADCAAGVDALAAVLGDLAC